MLRIETLMLRYISHVKTLRCPQHLARRFCSKTSDDSSSSPKPEPAEDNSEPEATSTASSSVVDKRNDSKYNRYEKNMHFSELLESLPPDPKNVSLEALLEFYENMKGNYLIRPEHLKHPKFNVLRKATESLAQQLNTKELKNVLVALLPSKAVMNDKLTQTVVNAMLERVIYLPFDQILFIDFLIHKYYDLAELSKDYSILRLKMQSMFLSKIEDEFDNFTEFEDVMKIIAYCENNVEIVPSKTVNRLTTSLLLQDDDVFAVTDIISIFIFLANLGKLDGHVEKLMRKVIDLWAQSDVTANEVDVLLRVLAAKSGKINTTHFKDPEFIRKCVNAVIQQDNRKISFSVQNGFNKLGIVSQSLIEHLTTFFETKDVRKFTLTDYIILCTACARSDYTPPNWDSVLQVLKTYKFNLYLSSFKGFDWFQFAIDLDKVGHCDIRMIQKIVNSKYLQTTEFCNQNKIEKLREILKRENASSSDSSSSDESDSESSESSDESSADDLSFYEDLRSMFGASKIWQKVKIGERLSIPYVLKMDLRSGDFLPFSKDCSVRDVTDNELLIGVVLITDNENDNRSIRHKLKLAKREARRIERNGISVIILEESKWSALKAYEKSLVFYTKIVNMMDFYRKKKLNELGKEY